MANKPSPRTPPITTALAHARVERGLSIRELADQVGYAKSTLSRIEKGDAVPTRQCARALFNFFEGAVAIADIYDPLFSMEVKTTPQTEPDPMTFEELNDEYARHKAATGHDFVTKLHMIDGRGGPKKPYGCDDCYRFAKAYEAMR